MALMKKYSLFSKVCGTVNSDTIRLLQTVTRVLPQDIKDDSFSTFKAKDLEITRTKSDSPLPNKDELNFGHVFSDHMFSVKWSDDRWSSPCISPFQNLSIHPAAKTLQYCIQVFEGMKAFRGHDNRIRLFRPMFNMNRMVSSAEKAGLPTFDPAELTQCIKTLISVDERWVLKSSPEYPFSLYLRPTMIGTEPALGVSSSNSAMLYVIIGPSGPYFKSGMKPISLLADPAFIRAWPGGTGMFKMGCNYAPTITVQNAAVSQGCNQMLWLFGEDHHVTEAGSMNFFMLWINKEGEKELITPPLDGLILPGVTRDSLLQLARARGDCKVSERAFTMKETAEAMEQNRVLEMFGSGTACVVNPINKIKYCGKWYEIDNPPTLCKELYKELMAIQYGEVHSDWMVEID